MTTKGIEDQREPGTKQEKYRSAFKMIFVENLSVIWRRHHYDERLHDVLSKIFK